MSDVTNSDRAQWAEIALATFTETVNTDREDAIADLICDLLHLARQDGLDPESQLERAKSNFTAEEKENA